MVDTRSEFERSWASTERKSDVEKREETYDRCGLQREVDVLNKKLEIYRSREATLCNELDKMRDREGKKEKSLQDLKQNNQLLVKKVLDQEKEIHLMRGRLKDNREKSINLSKEIFSLKQKKGLDDRSKKLRDENHDLKRELIQIRAERMIKVDQVLDGEDMELSNLNLQTKRAQQTKIKKPINRLEEGMGIEGLKWQHWASHKTEDSKGARVKWTHVRSALGETDFVTFQNEVEEVCQELQEKTSLIQKLRKDLRKKEDEFSNSFNKNIIEANEHLAKVKEEAAETIAKLQQQLEEKENVENSNIKLMSQIESMKSDKESLVTRYDADQFGKSNQIQALEKKIQTQEQVIKNMKEEIQDLRNRNEKLSADKLEETQDLQLQASALKAKAEALEKDVIELTATVERQKIDYLAQVQSLQLIIEELEHEGPLSRAIEALERTEMMEEVRLRVGDLKARNQRLLEENLKLCFQIDAASLELKNMEAIEEDSKVLRIECGRMKQQLDLFQSPRFDDVQNENLMLRERLRLVANELGQDGWNHLVEEAKEYKKKSSDEAPGSSIVKNDTKKNPLEEIQESIDEENWL